MVQQISLMDPGEWRDRGRWVRFKIDQELQEKTSEQNRIFLYMFHIGNPYSKEFGGFFGCGDAKNVEDKRSQKKQLKGLESERFPLVSS